MITVISNYHIICFWRIKIFPVYDSLFACYFILDELGDNMNPPYSKGNEEYTQWLEITLLKAVAKVSDSVLSRSLYTIRKYLKVVA